MAEEKAKLIPFTPELEEAIEADAKRCQRSFVRQVVAVLMTYYGVEDVEINTQKIKALSGQMLGEIKPKSDKTIQLIKNKSKRKAS